MITNKTILTITFSVVLIVIAILGFKINSNDDDLIKFAENIVRAEEDINLNLIKDDLKTYDIFSDSTVEDIYKAMSKASKKWDIPLGLMHGIFRTESEYRFWIDHPEVTVKIFEKPTNVRAVGIGGVIWEFWSDSLAKHNIAYRRTDLYIPERNIEASAAILRWIINQKLKKPTTNRYNLINEIITGYYGAYDKDYHEKMIRITSDLWLKRIAYILYTQEK